MEILIRTTKTSSIAVLMAFHAAKGKNEYNENNIKTRQRLDRDKTVLLLETWKQGKPTLLCSCQSNGPKK